MTDFTSHQAVTNLLRKAQEDDSDNRELARETQLFLHKKDGQWEPSIIQNFSDMERPRYTFDQCNDLVDDVDKHIRLLAEECPLEWESQKSEIQEKLSKVDTKFQILDGAMDVWNMNI